MADMSRFQQVVLHSAVASSHPQGLNVITELPKANV